MQKKLIFPCFFSKSPLFAHFFHGIHPDFWARRGERFVSKSVKNFEKHSKFPKINLKNLAKRV